MFITPYTPLSCGMEISRIPESTGKPSLVPSRSKKACASCRKNKAKCTGSFPSCGRCLSKGLVCVYEPSKVKKSKNSIQHLKDKMSQLEVEINVQKQLTEHWKRLIDQLSPKVSINPELVMKDSNILLKPFNAVSGIKPLYRHFEFSEQSLAIVNCVMGSFLEVGIKSQDIGLEEGKNDWNFLSSQMLSTSDFDRYSLDILVYLWERCYLFLAPTIYFSLDYQEQAVWNNCQALMRLVLWNKDLTRHPHLIPKVIHILIGISKFYLVHSRNGAALSCLTLAYNLGRNAKAWVTDELMDLLAIDILSNTSSCVERTKLMHRIEQKPFSSKIMDLRYAVIYCMILLDVKRFINQTESDDITMRLHMAESISDLVLGNGNTLGTFTKIHTYAMRSEVAYRQGYFDLGNDWLDSCLDALNSVADESAVQLFYSVLVLGRKGLLQPFKEENNANIIDRIIKSIEERYPSIEGLLDQGSRYPEIKMILHAFVFSPGLYKDLKRISEY